MRHLIRTAVGPLILVVSGAAAAAPGEEAALRKLDAAWSAAAAAKDAAATAAYYAEDGQALPFNGPIVTGRARIQEMWAGLMAKPGFALHFAPARIIVAKSRDVAIDIGTFELTMNDDHGKPVTAVGKFVVGWKKQKNGEWKVEADCFNTDR